MSGILFFIFASCEPLIATKLFSVKILINGAIKFPSTPLCPWWWANSRADAYMILININCSQLAKMKKSIPDMTLPMKFIGMKQLSEKLQIYFKYYDFCECVEFGQFRENLIFCQ